MIESDWPWSNVREDAVERSRDPRQVERLDEKAGVLDLAGAAAEEAAQLALGRPTLPLRLFLERAEGAEVTVPRENLLDDGGAEGTDQLVLEVGVAHVEPELLHSLATQAGAEPGLLEGVTEAALLAGVAQAGDPRIDAARADQAEHVADGLRATDGNHANPFRAEISPAPHCKCLESHLVARALDEDDAGGVIELDHGVNVAAVGADLAES